MCAMEGKVNTPYCTSFSANQGGIDKIYFSRQAGYVVTTQHNGIDEMVTRIRFDTAGCFDNDVAVRSMQDGGVIIVELAGQISKAVAINDEETIIAADDYVNGYPIAVEKGFTPESAVVCNSNNMYRNWYQTQRVEGEVVFKIPVGYKVDVSAEVLNGVTVVKFIQKILTKPKREAKWTNLTTTRFPSETPTKANQTNNQSFVQKCQENHYNTIKGDINDIDLITQLTKKYNL